MSLKLLNGGVKAYLLGWSMLFKEPICSEIEIICINCRKKLASADKCDSISIATWNQSSIGIIISTSGSVFDGYALALGICDTCSKKMVEDGRLIKIGGTSMN